MLIYIVTAEHWNVPGRHMSAFDTEGAAQERALDYLNVLRADARLPPVSKWEEFAAGLDELQDAKGAAHTYVEIQPVMLVQA